MLKPEVFFFYLKMKLEKPV